MLNDINNSIKDNPKITVIYFVKDKKKNGKTIGVIALVLVAALILGLIGGAAGIAIANKVLKSKEAIKEMNDLGIHGKESTPFLLAKICELTHGTSLESNIKLVLNNAKLGAEIALELSKL